jgi:putative ribosome biogenesis GTPase RsgA
MDEDRSKYISHYETFWNLFTKKVDYINMKDYVKKHKDVDNFAKDEDGTLIVMNDVDGELTNEQIGRLLLLASQKNVKKVIWKADEIKEEYITVVNWLNNLSEDKIEFYLVKSESIMTMDYRSLPKFTILASPEKK